MEEKSWNWLSFIGTTLLGFGLTIIMFFIIGFVNDKYLVPNRYGIPRSFEIPSLALIFFLGQILARKILAYF